MSMEFLGVGPAASMFIKSPCKEGFLKSYKEQFIGHANIFWLLLCMLPWSKVQKSTIMRGLYSLGAFINHQKTFNKELSDQITSKQKS